MVPVLHPLLLLPVAPPPVGEQVDLLRLALHRQVVRVLALEPLGALPGAVELADDRLRVDARLELGLLDRDGEQARELPGLLLLELLLLLAELLRGRARLGARLRGLLELLDVAVKCEGFFFFFF